MAGRGRRYHDAQASYFRTCRYTKQERCGDQIHGIDQSFTFPNGGVVRQLTIGLHDPTAGSPHTSPKHI